MYDFLLRDGEIIDPSQGLRTQGSVGIREGKIAAVGPEVSDPGAKAVFDLRGKIIAPGLIDLHCHPAHGFAALGVPVDEAGVQTGVTLLGDGGSAGSANFHAFRRLVVQPALTEVICFLNLATAGLIAMPEIQTLHDIDPELSRKVVEANRDLIRGIKVRAIQALAEGPGLQGIETAKKLGKA